MHNTSLLLAALISASALISAAAPVPAEVTYDFRGKGSEFLRAPPLEAIGGPMAVKFTIHARTKHDPDYGTSVKVWITPGMDERSPILKSCDPEVPACTGEKPDSAIVKRLFKSALNDALVENETGFGHYQVAQCEDPPRTMDSGFLRLAAKFRIQVDSRHDYSIVNLEKGKAASKTQYALAISEGNYERARFGPPPGHSNIEGLQHVWYLCKSQQLDMMTFVTQLRIPPAPPAPKM